MKKGYVVTGCGTDVGKTVVSAILTKAFDAHYWKPVQCGSLDVADADRVKKLTGLEVLSSRYLFKAPLSPHLAAKNEGVEIQVEKLKLPTSLKPLIVEGAGGVLVPFRDDLLFADLLLSWQLPLVFVSKHYLGSINHTLLSFEALQRRGLQIDLLVFNGNYCPDMERVMVEKSKARRIVHLYPEILSEKVIAEYAALWKKELL
jgi:dethiobiotin synthetase